MGRRTVRFPDQQLRDLATMSARRGMAEADYIRAALDRQLGRDSCLDELAAAEERALERHREIEARLAAALQHLARLERRVSLR